MASGRSTSHKRAATKPKSAAEALAAVERRDSDSVRLFLTSDIGDACCGGGPDGRPTMLQIAARNGDLKMVQLLIDFHCRINTQLSATGDTALMMALDAGHEYVAELLIQHEKCDYNAQNNAGYTALMKAAKAGLTRTMNSLLTKCPDLECTTVEGGDTALTLAVASGNPDAVHLLMEFGADLRHVTAGGKTAADLAWDLPETPAKRQICETLMQRRRGNCRLDDASDAAANLIGRRYKKLGTLGDGAHGLALLVRDMRDDSDASGSRLKVLKKVSRRLGEPGSCDAAMRETSLLKQLDHSCVLAILDYFTEDGTVCLVTEHCELRDLHPWIQWASENDVALPCSLVTHWFLQMLLGLNYLHEHRIIHRDFKPSNVFVKADATVRIGDFGCSRQMADSQDLARSISGTWIYMSPEVLQNDSYGTECDMWSLGCTLYELCTGRPLFDASPAVPKAQLTEKICRGEPPALPQEVDLPDWLRDAFARLMVRTPVGLRSSAAALLRSVGVRQALGAMISEDLAADRAFLDNVRAGVFVDDISGVHEFADYTHAYDPLLADAQRALETAAAAAGPESADMAELERLRGHLAEKQRAGFPLDKVYQLLLSAKPTTKPAEQRRLLGKVTRDTDTCDMVALAIVLEQRCLAGGAQDGGGCG